MNFIALTGACGINNYIQCQCVYCIHACIMHNMQVQNVYRHFYIYQNKFFIKKTKIFY